MADSINMEFSGMREIEAKFSELSQIDRLRFFSDIFSVIGNRLVREVQAATPVSRYGATSKKYPSRSHPAGAMRKSVGKKIGGDDYPTMWISHNRRGAVDTYYSRMVIGGHEVGNSRTKPNPIIRNTFDKMQPWIESECRKRAGDKLKAMIK